MSDFQVRIQVYFGTWADLATVLYQVGKSYHERRDKEAADYIN